MNSKKAPLHIETAIEVARMLDNWAIQPAYIMQDFVLQCLLVLATVHISFGWVCLDSTSSYNELYSCKLRLLIDLSKYNNVYSLVH